MPAMVGHVGSAAACNETQRSATRLSAGQDKPAYGKGDKGGRQHDGASASSLLRHDGLYARCIAKERKESDKHQRANGSGGAVDGGRDCATPPHGQQAPSPPLPPRSVAVWLRLHAATTITDANSRTRSMNGTYGCTQRRGIYAAKRRMKLPKMVLEGDVLGGCCTLERHKAAGGHWARPGAPFACCATSDSDTDATMSTSACTTARLYAGHWQRTERTSRPMIGSAAHVCGRTIYSRISVRMSVGTKEICDVYKRVFEMAAVVLVPTMQARGSAWWMVEQAADGSWCGAADGLLDMDRACALSCEAAMGAAVASGSAR
ncbi:hypothetical protein THASP1DRAFT_22246 [Thamnocephalis sphaerospora]|uniref:Uncharacterized protein n=1 Tax=Thamnocephalis sphaerospora TaxID=78915 RepID=A0A4P9XUR9_9FUNG|nr:hypothetical protein THASP1DRAFT_22246 [Thamnocephalis sphaerospora]|eukprot:RKP09978.1 hypothetical protein THASP1DRAFT_22246 [Thamnocephalis sphaerospora]